MKQVTHEEKECPNCGVMAPAKQIENLGQCERHQVNSQNDGNRKDDHVKGGVSIIETRWRKNQ